MKTLVAIHRWNSNAAYSPIGRVAAANPPATGNGSFQIEPWKNIAPIMTRMNQVATCSFVRCAASARQLTQAIQMLAASRARNNVVSNQPTPLERCSPVFPDKKSQASTNGLVRMDHLPDMRSPTEHVPPDGRHP